MVVLLERLIARRSKLFAKFWDLEFESDELCHDRDFLRFPSFEVEVGDDSPSSARSFGLPRCVLRCNFSPDFGIVAFRGLKCVLNRGECFSFELDFAWVEVREECVFAAELLDQNRLFVSWWISGTPRPASPMWQAEIARISLLISSTSLWLRGGTRLPDVPCGCR